MVSARCSSTKSVTVEATSFGTSHWVEIAVEDLYGSKIDLTIFFDDVTLFQSFRAQVNSSITKHLASERFQHVLTNNHE